MAPKGSSSTSDRRKSLLDAAFATFVRYGYRKTSMDDVAREADISRQALYAHFADKEALFRECMKHDFERAMAEVDAALSNEEIGLPERLLRAIDQWLGRHVERVGTDGADLGEAAHALLGTFFADCSAVFERKLARAIAASPCSATCKEAKVTPLQMAETLSACARGWKHRATSRPDFVAQMDTAIRLLIPKARNK